MRCFDHKTKSIKAVKVIRNKKRFHHQALVEVKILEHLRHKDPDNVSGVVRMHEYFYFRNHLCISFEPLSSNLYEFVKNNNFRGLSLSLIRRFAAQLLQSLKFLRSQRVIHCDLKPENILLRQPNKSAIKVIDFGSSCFEDERAYTYIQSRFYRSPEVILGTPYDEAIDMWSLGCILAELYTGYPLFPGENEAEQLACIMEALGTPPDPRSIAPAAANISSTPPARRARRPTRGKATPPGHQKPRADAQVRRPRVRQVPRAVPAMEPADRHTPEEALAHEWIASAASAARNQPTPPPRATPPPPPRRLRPREHRTPEPGPSREGTRRGGGVHFQTERRADADVVRPGRILERDEDRRRRIHQRRVRHVEDARGAHRAIGGIGSNHGSGSGSGTGSGTGSSRGGRDGGSGSERLPPDGLGVSSTARRFSGMRVGSDGREEKRAGGAVLPRLARGR